MKLDYRTVLSHVCLTLVFYVQPALASHSTTELADVCDATLPLNHGANAEIIVISDYMYVLDSTPDGTNIGVVSVVADPGAILSFSIETGNADSAFVIDEATGTLYINSTSALDFSRKPVYDLGITVKDKQGNQGNGVFTVRLVDSRSPATESLAVTIKSTAAPNSVVALLPTNEAVAYALLNWSNKFSLEGNRLIIKVNPADEVGMSYVITAKSGLSQVRYEITVTIVSDVGTAPTDILLSNNRIEENNSASVVLGIFTTVDSDIYDTHEYMLVPGSGSGDNESFRISLNRLVVKYGLNYEEKNVYFIRVRTTDQTGLFYEKEFQIVVEDSDDIVIVRDASSIIDENTVAGTNVVAVSIVDDEHVVTGYEIVDGNIGNAFRMEGSMVVVNNTTALNFEEHPSFRLVVDLRVSVPFQYVRKGIITISLKDINEPPLDIQLSSTRVGHGHAENALIGTLSTTDPDANESFEYSLVAGPGSDDNSHFQITGDRLTARHRLDYDAQRLFNIRVRTLDKGGMQFDKAFTIEVVSPDEVIIVHDVTLPFDENRPAGTLVFALDITNAAGASQISIAAGNVDNAFRIEGTNLVVNNATAFNYEEHPTFTLAIEVTPRSASAFVRNGTITIQLRDMNDRPTGIFLSNTIIQENNFVPALLGSIQTFDEDSWDAHRYSLVPGPGSDDNDKFSLLESEILLRVRTDFEVKNVYKLRVRSTDRFGLYIEMPFEITVENVDDDVLVKDAEVKVDENTSTGTYVATISSEDQDGLVTGYEIIDGNFDDAFQIDGATIKVKNSNALDFEKIKKFTLSVAALLPSTSYAYTQPGNVTIIVNDINEVPTDILLSNDSIKERNAADALVGTFTTADPDANELFQYSLVSGVGSDNNDAFNIVGHELRARYGFDYDVKNSFTIRVRTTDQNGLGLYYEKSFEIKVTDRADIVIVQDATATLEENSPNGADVANITAIDDDNLVTGFEIVEGNVGDAFRVEGSTIKVNNPLAVDFETQPEFTLVVNALVSTPSAQVQKGIITINVTDIDDTVTGPTDILLSNNRIEENNSASVVIGTFSTVDSDVAATHEYTLVAGSGSDDNSAFRIAGNRLIVRYNLNYEEKNTYTIRVRSTSSFHEYVEKQFQVIVEDAEDIVIISHLTTEVDENSIEGTAVTPMVVVDDEHVVTGYRIVDGNIGNAFKLDGPVLKVNNPAALDFERTPVFMLTIEAVLSSPDVYASRGRVTVQLRDMNESPLDLELTNSNVDEHILAPAWVGNFVTRDPDHDDSHLYSLVDGPGGLHNAFFIILEGKLLLNEVPDFEKQSRYSIRVRSTDTGGLSVEKEFSIEVTDRPDRPEVIDVKVAVGENAAEGTVVTALTATSPDSEIASYVIESGNESNVFKLDAITGFLRVDGKLNFEQTDQYVLSVLVTNQFGLGSLMMVTVDVFDENDPPVSIRLTNTGVNENTPAPAKIGEFLTEDEDRDDMYVYTLVPGDGDSDNDLFSINGSDLYLNEMPDYEIKSTYQVRVRSTDSYGQYIEQPYIIAVVDSVDAPIVTDLFVSIGENAGVGTLVTKIETANADIFTTYEISAGNASSVFELDRISGELTVRGSLNFETTAEYLLSVIVKNSSGLNSAMHITVLVEDENDPPVGIRLSNSEVRENSTALPAKIGELATIDEDRNDTFVYALVGGPGDFDNHLFRIADNVLYLNVAADYEQNPEYQIRVRTTDAKYLSYENEFVITVIDEAEAPVSRNIIVAISENSQTGTLVATIPATDPENDITKFEIQGGNEYGTFAIGQVSGEITVNTSTALNYELKSSYSLVVKVTDRTMLSSSLVVTINVIDLNEEPTDITLSNSVVKENASAPIQVGLIHATDPDFTEQFTYQLVQGADDDFFRIDGSVLWLTQAPDFEIKEVYVIGIRVTDKGGLSFEKEFRIAIENANDPPFFQSKTVSLVENALSGAIVTELGAIDPEGDAVRLTIISGNIGNAFTIDQGANQLKVSDGFVINFEELSTYTLLLEASDADGGTTRAIINVNVIDMNEEVTDLLLSRQAITENHILNYEVGTLTAEDEDLNDQHVFTLVEGVGADDNADFAIQGGRLFKLTYSNFENRVSYSIRVKAADLAGHSFEKQFEIAITDLNEDALLFIPTLFSPNGDGSNDRFVVHSDEIEEISLVIYSPVFGEVFRSSDKLEAIEAGWDGTKEGEDMPPGVYIWNINGRFKSGRPLLFKGSNTGTITLVR